jgi:hypothetical protein
MSISHVCILYKPQLYIDLFALVLQSQDSVKIVNINDENPYNGSGRRGQVNVVLLPVDYSGQPELALLPFPIPNAKILAFSPQGDLGLRRMPGEDNWIEIRPFGLDQLVQEVIRSPDSIAA